MTRGDQDGSWGFGKLRSKLVLLPLDLNPNAAADGRGKIGLALGSFPMRDLPDLVRYFPPPFPAPGAGSSPPPQPFASKLSTNRPIRAPG